VGGEREGGRERKRERERTLLSRLLVPRAYGNKTCTFESTYTHLVMLFNFVPKENTNTVIAHVL
jgi:hypothetical protein